MNSLFTSITYSNGPKTFEEKALELASDFISMGGRKIEVLSSGKARLIEKKEDDVFKTALKTALKIALYSTLIIPLIALVTTAVLRPKLQPQEPKRVWLNDIQVNGALSKLVEKHPGSCYIDSLVVNPEKLARITKLYPLFRSSAEKSITKLFDKKTVLIPVNVNSNHWALFVADIQKRRLAYYDSLSGPIPAVATSIRAHLEKVANEEGVALEPADFAAEVLPCPQQPNTTDCGVYLILTAEHILENKPLTYTQSDVDTYRLNN
ncbi:MAG: hypothetical protein JSR37_05660 [Verrucomicrobia bacterium]|nr:hypothetical protein [Verrucomicrobiota bacterium]MBS0636952.1 hypothetical protein [Verrucomicrobiota bacterium]